MARSVETIFNEMVAQKETTPELSMLTSTSATAIWRLLLYVAAFAIAVHERLWDTYREEVEAEVNELMPHGRLWYRNKVLGFMKDMTLVEGTDEYDTEGMTEAEVEAARVVKYAAVNERAATSKIDIKVAGRGSGGERAPLGATEEAQLRAYIAEVKDAGVQTVLWNQAADEIKCQMTIYYNPIRDPQTVQTECEAAIREYVENLPFNGVMTKREMAERLMVIDGVRLVGEITAEVKAATAQSYSSITDYGQPEAGYYSLEEAVLTMTAYNI